MRRLRLGILVVVEAYSVHRRSIVRLDERKMGESTHVNSDDADAIKLIGQPYSRQRPLN